VCRRRILIASIKGAFAILPWYSPPLMLRVALLKLFLQAGIRIAPETGKILRDLHWPLVGGQDLDHERLSSHGNGGRLREAVEFLDAGRQHGWCIRSIANTGAASTRQWQPFRGVGVEEVFLSW